MSNHRAEATLEWGDGDYGFRLTVAQCIELEQKCNAPFATILQRVERSEWCLNDLRETIRLGLIGGGAKPADAVRLVKAYVDERPLAESWPVARYILLATMFGFQESPLGNQEAAANPKGWTPPLSTELAQLLA